MAGGTLQRSLRGLAITLCVITMAVVGVYALSSLLPLSKSQQRSLAVLQQNPQDFTGKNAFAVLATLDIDGLDATQRQARVDAFLPRYEQWKKKELELTNTDKIRASEPPKLAEAGDLKLQFDQRLCTFQEAAKCLEKVREHPQETALALAQQQDLLHRISELAEYGHYKMPFALLTTYPSTQLLATSLAAHASTYLQGNTDAAIAGICNDANSARMLMAHSDNLLTTMVGGKMFASNVELLASLLAELPAETPLPDNCTKALAQTSSMEISTCVAMRGEFRNFEALSRSNMLEFRKAKAKIFFNDKKTNARHAETMAEPCLPENLSRIKDDLTLPPASTLSLYKLECVANYIGCILSSIATPSYSNFVADLQDYNAELRLLNAVQWLREHAAEQTNQSLNERLQSLPSALKQGARNIHLSADGRALELPSYSPRATGKPLSMPIPKALIDSGTTPATSP